METTNRACNYVAQIAFTTKVFSRFKLEKLSYRDVRLDYPLSGAAAQLVAKKVSEAYKIDKRKIRNFRKLGAIPLDRRVLSYKKNCIASISTPGGRLLIKMIPREGVAISSKKEAKLVYSDGRFYIHQSIDVQEPDTKPTTDFLGVDLGIKNIAYDSDGTRFAGAHLNNLRRRQLKLRKKLQKKGTKSAKRLLKKRRKREARFVRDTNHCISKKLVLKALGTSRGVAIENLKGIRKRSITAKKPQSKDLRRDLNSWSFFQLRSFITYKCKLYGVQLEVVDPKYTSVTCPSCGCRDKKNRKTRDKFKCFRCSYSGYADHIASINIKNKALDVNGRVDGLQPHAPGSHALGVTVETKVA
jgi:IS605 OrfB family transposase